ncbi:MULTISPECIES: hypothetical protein [unclassified Peribacillus]|uniref:hypothetical protein n=1 Tax=unclassified Peribacillus TaxID=2675266 RepID=UPI00366A7774
MNDALRKARAQRHLEFGILCQRIDEHEGKFSRNVLRRLSKCRSQFNATVNDQILGELIKSNLSCLAEMELFVKARNAGDSVAEYKHRKEATRLWDEGSVIAIRITEELS